MSFQPNNNDTLNIISITYRIAEHPYAPGMPYGQEGRQAVVYKLLGPEQKEVGLKVFKPRFRIPGMVTLAVQLAQLANIPGLAVCRRTVLSARKHSEVLNQFPDLTYAVLMPWLAGPTWMEVMLGETELTPGDSLKYARFLTEVLTSMEERNIAHCDLSGPNLIMTGMLDPNATVPVALVDVEQMYGPEIQRPVALPGGSPGYAHPNAAEGIWSPEADRFAGAVLIAEMLGWCDTRVRKSSWGESFFDPDEMQQDGERYQVLMQVLRERWGKDIAGLFKRAWESELIHHAPTFGDWLIALPKTDSVSVNDKIQEIDSSPSAEELTSGSNDPVVIERYFVICPNCKTRNEILPDEEITTLKCKSCSGNMNPSHASKQEVAVTTDLISNPAKSSTAGSSRPIWGFFAVVVAIIMMLGWVNSSQNGEMKVRDLKLRLRTKDQKIRQVNRKIQDILIKMDESQLVRINDIKLRNENKNSKALGNYTNRFRQKDIRYISYYIQIENIAAGIKSIDGKMYAKYVSPDGTTIRNPKTSPAKFTMVEKFSLTNDVCELTSGWGNSSGGIYEVGTYEIEFWYKDRLLGKTAFTVY